MMREALAALASGVRCPVTSLCILVLVAALPTTQAFAQPTSDFQLGSRVRLVAPTLASRPLKGTIARLDATALELQMADRKERTLVPRDAITKIEISLGRRSRTRGALIGGSLGAAIGVAAVLATPDSCRPGDLFGCPTLGISQGEAAVFFGAVGAASGALIGALIPPGERWKAMAAGPRVDVRPGRKGGVQASLFFRF